MNCRLCGQPTAGPSKLCRDCDAALRRARKGASGMGAPSQRTSEVEAAAGAAVVLPSRSKGTGSRSASPRLAVWLALGVIVMAGTYLVGKGFGPRPAGVMGLDSGVPAQRALPQPDAAPAAVSPPQTGVGPDGVTTGAERATPPAPARSILSPTGSEGPGKAAGAGATAARAGSAPSRAAPVPDKTITPSIPRIPDPVSQPPERPAVMLAAAPSALPVESPERWKGLANAVAKCAERGGFAGMLCDQKVRLEYCEGAWEKVPDCSRPQRYQP